MINNSRKTDAAVPPPVTAAAEAQQSISQNEVWMLIKKIAFRLRQQNGSILRGKLPLSGACLYSECLRRSRKPSLVNGSMPVALLRLMGIRDDNERRQYGDKAGVWPGGSGVCTPFAGRFQHADFA